MNNPVSTIAAAVAAVVMAAALSGCAPATGDAAHGEAQPAASGVSEKADSPGADSPETQEEPMDARRIVVTVNGWELTATLEDTEAAREFASLLPLRLQMEELNGNEKYAYLADPLPTGASNPGTIHAGDIMLFGSSCVVLFYETFPTQYTYTPIARLDDPEGLAELLGEDDVEAAIELA